MRLRVHHRGKGYDLPFDHVTMIQDDRRGALVLSVPGSRVRVHVGDGLTPDELELVRRTISRSSDEGLPSIDLDQIAHEARMGRKPEPRHSPATGLFVIAGWLAFLVLTTSFRSPFAGFGRFATGLFGPGWGAGALVVLFGAVTLAWHALEYAALFAFCTFTIEDYRRRPTPLASLCGLAVASLSAILVEWRFALGPLRPGLFRDLGADLAGAFAIALALSISREYIRLPKRARPAQAQP